MIQIKVFIDEYLIGDPDTYNTAEEQLNEFLQRKDIEFVDIKCGKITHKIFLVLVYREV